ncbi:MAG: hypothetical protein U5K38_10435 [Woeseiaceae bacterium]|nr:hypothetical protein [Woeseiaceae bacterium]
MRPVPEALAPARQTGPVATWALRHVSTLIGSLGRLARQPFATLMTVLVIAITLPLPAAMHLVVEMHVRSAAAGTTRWIFQCTSTRPFRWRPPRISATSSRSARMSPTSG